MYHRIIRVIPFITFCLTQCRGWKGYFLVLHITAVSFCLNGFCNRDGLRWSFEECWLLSRTVFTQKSKCQNWPSSREWSSNWIRYTRANTHRCWYMDERTCKHTHMSARVQNVSIHHLKILLMQNTSAEEIKSWNHFQFSIKLSMKQTLKKKPLD